MNNYLETAISVILIFVIFSIITYVIQELVAINLRYRGKMLWKSISQLLDGFVVQGRLKLNSRLQTATGATPNTNSFFQHAQIKSLQKDLNKLPFYIPASNFALTMMDMVAKAATNRQGDFLKDIGAGLPTFSNANGNIYAVMKNLLDTSETVEELQKKLENWYNDYMDRVTGWYKSHTVVTIRLIAIGVTLFFNINIIKLTREIYNNAQMRAGLVAIAQGITDHPEVVSEFYTRNFEEASRQIDALYKEEMDTAQSPEQRLSVQKKIDDQKAVQADKYTKKRFAAIDSLTRQLSVTGLPIGWKQYPWEYNLKAYNLGEIFLVLLGWSIAAGCISMGAPFWFDLLIKLVNLRRAGIKPGAEDKRRQ
jgi:hypothetical protein